MLAASIAFYFWRKMDGIRCSLLSPWFSIHSNGCNTIFNAKARDSFWHFSALYTLSSFTYCFMLTAVIYELYIPVPCHFKTAELDQKSSSFFLLEWNELLHTCAPDGSGKSEGNIVGFACVSSKEKVFFLLGFFLSGQRKKEKSRQPYGSILNWRLFIKLFNIN